MKFYTQEEAATERRAKCFLAIFDHRRQIETIPLFYPAKNKAIQHAKQKWEYKDRKLLEV